MTTKQRKLGKNQKALLKAVVENAIDRDNPSQDYIPSGEGIMQQAAKSLAGRKLVKYRRKDCRVTGSCVFISLNLNDYDFEYFQNLVQE